MSGLRRVIVGASLLALACAAVAGCGSESGTDSDTGAGTATEPTSPVGPTRVQFPFGRWQGRLAQRGLKPFQIRVAIRSRDNRLRNRVHYTGIDCGGIWTYLRRHGPDLLFREMIDRGRGGECKGTGTVTLRYVADDRLRYEFRGGGVSSSGFLRPND